MVISQAPIVYHIRSAPAFLNPHPGTLVKAGHVLVLGISDIEGPVMEGDLFGDKAGIVREESLEGVVNVLVPDHFVECELK